MMESACLRHTEIPGTSSLFSDFQYHFDRVARYYNGWPGDPDSFVRAANALNYPSERRAALVEALRGQNEGNPSLDLLAKPGTVAVVTGQQVGLFSGPSYTVYKALTAARLARQLSDQGIPAVQSSGSRQKITTSPRSITPSCSTARMNRFGSKWQVRKRRGQSAESPWRIHRSISCSRRSAPFRSAKR
jgi:hypothetical protein